MADLTRPGSPRRASYLLAPGAVVAVVLLMVLPLPPFVLDLLLSMDIGVSVVLVLTAVYVRQPIEFSVCCSR
jgi:flagellar biosynthesis protein FlhA